MCPIHKWRFFLPLHFTLYTNVSFIKIAISFPFLILCLIPPRDDREKTDRTTKELRHNSQTTKRLFLNTTFLKRLTKVLKKLTPFLKQLPSCISFAFLRTLFADSSLFISPESYSGVSCLYTLRSTLLHQKYLHIFKKYCNFAPEMIHAGECGRDYVCLSPLQQSFKT